MKHLVISTAAAAALLAALSQAHAADMQRAPVYTKAPPPEAAYNWSGFYIFGYGSYSANFAGMDTTLFPTSPTPTSINLASIPHGPGFGGGLEALWQASGSPWVIGAEADIGGMNLSNGSALSSGGVSALRVSNQTNYLGAINIELAHAGFDPRLLLGIKGGFAFGGAKPDLTVAAACAGGTDCKQAISDTSIGWDFAAFMKYAIFNNFVLGLEGRYTDLGSRTLTVVPTGGTVPIATSTAKYNFFTQMLTGELKISPN